MRSKVFLKTGGAVICLRRTFLPILACSFITVSDGRAALPPVPAASEFAEAARWTTAKFEPTAKTAEAKPGLYVLANHDPVQFNARSGKPLNIAGVPYTHGLYCHAFSKVVVRLPGPAEAFTSIIGVDSNDETSGGRGSVHFSVVTDGKVQFKSKEMHEGIAGVPVKVNLNGAKEFVLQVDDAGDGISCDQSDWADARVKLKDGRELWLADLGFGKETFSKGPPFSFVYGGKSSTELLRDWKV
ncbi:MAG TPA: NPCBM/NEW2 domain-containing protein, partial [Verrucomicrobiae bacterium]|nr:NPCBM/NEW2 domain-containing protein [Verrucomicrobiae bacterium]